MEKEFIRVIQDNEGILFKVSNLYSNNEVDAQDLRQEMILQLWRSFKTFSGKSKISTWMYRVALNTAIVFLKKSKRNIETIEIDTSQIHPLDKKDTVIEERIQMLYTIIKKLNDVDRGIILLYLEGKPYDEIAEITGFSVSNIGTRMGRIKLKLKSFLNI